MFGFIILRHVNSEKTNLYWIENVKCIRKLYSNPILIIDDNSDKRFLTNDTIFDKVTVVQSEFIGRGEILPYYYFHKLKLFDTAVIIHDSVFIQKYIEFDKVTDVQFLWHFYHYWDSIEEELSKIKYLKNHQRLLETFYDKSKWLGCFGGMTCMTYNFLNKLVENYDIFKLLDVINNRCDRTNFERILAVLCYSETSQITMNGYIFEEGIIEYSFDDYLMDKNNIKNKRIVKVWTGR